MFFLKKQKREKEKKKYITLNLKPMTNSKDPLPPIHFLSTNLTKALQVHFLMLFSI